MTLQQRFLEIIARNIANANTTRTAEGGPYRRQIGVASGGTGGPTAEISQDPQPGRLVYDPGHPDANEAGFVEYPNVDSETEIVDLMVARRAFEANASVFEAAKNMLKRALEI
jgi:flagellar basal-body rod protein FlgC